MMLIDIPRIPPEGLDLDEAVDPASVHLEGESEFELEPGGRLCVHVDLVDETTVHVRGRLSGSVRLDCGRCLERYAVALDHELDLFFLPHAKEPADDQEDEVELSDREVVVGCYEGTRLDLGEVVREQIFLSLPLKRLCHEECRGLCPTCGKNLNAGDCGCPPREEPVDPRLLALRRLIDKN
jgi:uncharacterized protein